MNDHELRSLYPSVHADGMRTRVLDALHEKRLSAPRGKLRTGALICTVLIALLALTVGAAAIRGIRILLPRGEADYVWIRDPESGAWQKEYTYIVQTEEKTVSLSPEAIARLTPYVLNQPDTPMLAVNSRNDAEKLLGIDLHLPEGRYTDVRLAAYSDDAGIFLVNVFLPLETTSGRTISVTAKLPLQDAALGGSVNIVSDATDTAVYKAALSDGTPAQIVLTRAERSTAAITTLTLRAAAYYNMDGVVYSFTVNETYLSEEMPADAESRLLAEVYAILSTVK